MGMDLKMKSQIICILKAMIIISNIKTKISTNIHMPNLTVKDITINSQGMIILMN
jgi:hypothetical protein